MTSDISTIPETADTTAVFIDAQDPVARDRWVRRRIVLAWGMLVLNTLTFYPSTYAGVPLVVPIPSMIGKAITQGALVVALILLLTVNRRMAIRPNFFLLLVSLLVVEAFLTSLHVAQFSNAYRSIRFAEFVVALWLLSPWWGRRDLLLIRCHLTAASVFLSSVVLGLLVAHRAALAKGRLEGVLWPTPPSQIAEFAAIMIGLIVVLWLGGLVSGRLALATVIPVGAILLLTHARGPLIGMIAGIVVAGLSLFTRTVRVRKFLATAGVAVLVGAMTSSAVAKAWWARGEPTYELARLTGRTPIWAGLLSVPRDQFQIIFGSGLSDQGYSGLSIDSSWLIAYTDQGLYAVAICAAMLVYLLVAARSRACGIQRALALFIATYCMLLSFEEAGVSAPSTFLLYLALAASLLVRSQVD